MSENMNEDLPYKYYDWSLDESDQVEITPPIWEAKWYDEAWFTNDAKEYEMQQNMEPEDPGMIAFEIFKRNDFPTEFIAAMRWWNDIFVEIWKTELSKWDRIILDEWWPNEYELQVWNQVYALNTMQNTVFKVAE